MSYRDRKLAIMALALLWILCLSGAAFAANKIELKVDRTHLTTADLLRADVVVTLDNEDAVSDIQMPDFDGFRIANRNTSTQSYTSIQNFKMTSSKTLTTTFLLEPGSPGVFVLGPASLKDSGRLVQSQRVEVTVSKLDAADSQTGAGENAVIAPLSAREQETPNLFIRLIPERSSLVQGEQMTATLYVYVGNVSASNLSVAAPSNFDGFAVDELKLPDGDKARKVVIGQTIYHVQAIMRFLLTAQSVGEHTFSPYRIKLMVNDGQFFGGRMVQFASDPVAVTVEPLPTENQPAGFSVGNVGQFGLSATVDRRTTEVGQPVTLTLTLSGNSNMDRVMLPAFTTIPGARVYPPTEDKQSWQEGDRLVGKRTAEYLIVPNDEGRIRIPSLTFAYYDTQAKDYRTLSTPDFVISAVPATGKNGEAVQSAAHKQDLFASDDSLRPFAPKAELENRNGRFVGSPLFLALFWGPLALILGVLALDALRLLTSKLSGGERGRREKRARELADSLPALAAAKDKSFASQLVAYIYLKLELALNASFAGLTYDQLAQALSERGLSPARIAGLLEILHACDVSRYAPGAQSASEELLARATEWLKELGR